MTNLRLLFAAIAGFGVGGLVGLSGIGGSALMTPILIFGFGLRPLSAVGTDMLYASVTKTFGAWQHSRLDTIQWSKVGWMAAGSLPATALALATMVWLQSQLPMETVNRFVAHLLGGVLLLVALVLLAQTLRPAESPERAERRRYYLEGPSWRYAYVLSGAVVAVLVAFTSVGGGSLLFVILALTTRLPTAQIVGTDIAHAALITTVDAISHLYMGNVKWELGMALITGTFPGVWLGSRASVHLPDRWLRRGIAALLLITGLRMV